MTTIRHTKRILTPSQQDAIEHLLPLAELATSGRPGYPGGLRGRTHTLLCGPSGIGKSHLARSLGKELGVETLIINASSWLPLGSRAEEKSWTWSLLFEFIQRNERGVILIDEIDKIYRGDRGGGGSEWLGHVRLELHDLLDGVIPASLNVEQTVDDWFEVEDGQASFGVGKTPPRARMEESLKGGFFIVGAGAWQHLWREEEKSAPLGFAPVKSSVACAAGHPSSSDLLSSLSSELRRRFRHEVVFIRPMSAADCRKVAQEMGVAIGATNRELAGEFLREVNKRLGRPREVALGMRLFEEALCSAEVTLLKAASNKDARKAKGKEQDNG